MAETRGETSQYEANQPVSTARDAPRRPLHADGSANGHAPTPTVTMLPPHSPTDQFLIPDPPPVPVSILADGKHSLCGTAIRSFCLGAGLGVSATATAGLLYYGSELWRLPFFILALSIFHFLEFYTTARYNTQAASMDAFLLTSNGTAYNIAHVVAALETTVMHSVWAYPEVIPPAYGRALIPLGLTLMVLGQLARSVAMKQAGTNFNHLVQANKRRGHELVTTGIYATLRHPSYFGFYYWAIGGQIVLGNVLSLTAYMAVLWRFFSWRIRGEERLLVKFFGSQYEEYRKRTYTGIPFVP